MIFSFLWFGTPARPTMAHAQWARNLSENGSTEATSRRTRGRCPDCSAPTLLTTAHRATKIVRIESVDFVRRNSSRPKSSSKIQVDVEFAYSPRKRMTQTQADSRNCLQMKQACLGQLRSCTDSSRAVIFPRATRAPSVTAIL